jgi:hypothetical protein
MATGILVFDFELLIDGCVQKPTAGNSFKLPVHDWQSI